MMNECTDTDEHSFLSVIQLIKIYESAQFVDRQTTERLNTDGIFWLSSTLQQAIINEDNTDWLFLNEQSKHFFSSKGEEIKSECITTDNDTSYQITCCHAFKNSNSSNEETAARRYNEILKLHTQKFLVVVEHYKTKGCRKRKRDKRNRSGNIAESGCCASGIQTTKPPTAESVASGNNTKEEFRKPADTKCANTTREAEIEDIKNKLQESIDISLETSRSESHDGPLKKSCHTGDVIQSILDYENQKPIDYVSDDNVSNIGKLVKGWENLGPTERLSKRDTLYNIAEDYKFRAPKEWAAIKTGKLRKIWSVPYYVEWDDPPLKLILMFSLENYNRQQFKIRSKLLDEFLNQRLSLPVTFCVEIKLRRSLSNDFEDEFFDPVKGQFKWEVLNEYSSTDILIPFEQELDEEFPDIYIKIISAKL